eukprot:TRINITY_DN20929_c0_g1_i1.p2 TRINITY_DN20929_c0_g1~~TRINITY_DN20929_c0_g1_i1.p2  ORF type:complete len:168 (-),score=43.12 TRINITY_DN20929_c0_g1_i1:24-527(-)
MQKEFSVENIMFWEACVGYEACFVSARNSPEKAPKLAIAICENFIKESGAFSVNLPYRLRKEILDKTRLNKSPSHSRKLMSAASQVQVAVVVPSQTPAPAPLEEKKEETVYTAELFLEAKQEIFNLMLKDTFVRFKMTEEFGNWKQKTTTFKRNWPLSLPRSAADQI